MEGSPCNSAGRSNANANFGLMGRSEHIDARIQIAFSGVSIDRRSMGQQHRTRAKRRRRRAYLQHKKTSLRSTRREPAKPRAKKEPVTPESCRGAAHINFE